MKVMSQRRLGALDSVSHVAPRLLNAASLAPLESRHPLNQLSERSGRAASIWRGPWHSILAPERLQDSILEGLGGGPDWLRLHRRLRRRGT